MLSGDTIRVGNTTYCLKGIDAPELGQICKRSNGRDYNYGHIAKTAQMDLTASSTVKCSGRVKQNFCILGSCEAGFFDLSQNMVHMGWALSTGLRFASIQTQAKGKKPGLWKGNFDTLWIRRELQKQL